MLPFKSCLFFILSNRHIWYESIHTTDINNRYYLFCKNKHSFGNRKLIPLLTCKIKCGSNTSFFFSETWILISFKVSKSQNRKYVRFHLNEFTAHNIFGSHCIQKTIDIHTYIHTDTWTMCDSEMPSKRLDLRRDRRWERTC